MSLYAKCASTPWGTVQLVRQIDQLPLYTSSCLFCCCLCLSKLLLSGTSSKLLFLLLCLTSRMARCALLTGSLSVLAQITIEDVHFFQKQKALCGLYSLESSIPLLLHKPVLKPSHITFNKVQFLIIHLLLQHIPPCGSCDGLSVPVFCVWGTDAVLGIRASFLSAQYINL